MRVLWIVNTIFPYPAEKIGVGKTVFGGWLNSLAIEIANSNNIELAIATVYNGKSIKKFFDGKVYYFLIPQKTNKKYSKKTEKYWKEITNIFKPDLVHIHGTEYNYGLSFQNACPDIKTIVSIQGVISSYAESYYGNIKTIEIIENITLRDIIRKDTIIQGRKRFEKNIKNEQKILNNSKAVLGRTWFDYSVTKSINSNIRYYLSNELLRDSFYNNEWNINNIEKYSIFVSQGTYPIKGLHYALKTIKILKEQYPDVKLYIAGKNITQEKVKLTGYAKYINKLIKEYRIEENIIFTGILNENELIERLLKTNVFLLPSAIENSSNSLCEAMMLGMPCVATNTGGTMDMLKHDVEGYLYPYTESAMSAQYISKLFDNNELCLNFAENAKKHAIERHDKLKIVQGILKIYEEVRSKI